MGVVRVEVGLMYWVLPVFLYVCYLIIIGAFKGVRLPGFFI
jgi:hypothetical protein